MEILEDRSNTVFPVERLATITIGGSPPRHFAINCISTSNDGSTILWSRDDGTSLHLTQKYIVNGVQLDLANAKSSDLTVYRCTESNTMEIVTINVTNGKWNRYTQV